MIRARRKAYSEREIAGVPCVKCGAPSVHQWRICSTNGWSAVCRQHDIEINRMVATWAFGEDAAEMLMQRYEARA